MTRTANSLTEYLAEVEAIKSDWEEIGCDRKPTPWFRGHPDETWILEPSLLRVPFLTDAAEREEFLDREFRGRAIAFIRGQPPSTVLEWCFFTRHYGLPTRLLDWTESSLVALYFAVGGDERLRDQAGCVWMLYHTWLLNKAFGESRRDDAERLKIIENVINRVAPLETQVPLPVRPPYINPRIAAQHSCFTLHPIALGAFDRLKAMPDGDRAIAKIIIPKDRKKDLVDELRQAGITEVVLFPDLDGLARDLAASPLPDRRSYISGAREPDTAG